MHSGEIAEKRQPDQSPLQEKGGSVRWVVTPPPFCQAAIPLAKALLEKHG